MLEDTRTFDQEALAGLLKSVASRSPAARRARDRPHRLSEAARDGRAERRHDAGAHAARDRARDTDVEVAGTVVFSTGQLKDNDAVSWLGELLSAPGTPDAVAREAACSLGKIRSPEARTALAKYLADAPATAAPAVVGEALLSSGRFTGPRRPRAHREMVDGERRRGPLARDVGALPPARSGGGRAVAAPQRGCVSGGAVLGRARPGVRGHHAGGDEDAPVRAAARCHERPRPPGAH